ncbi:5'-methylthioadenosine/adenosylhomocysteine nucleosidase [Roseburia sp. 499]|uniref:5'-methylthioadenosine/adenosylhomocysteine nucleosidase n=1 Tax=Roseburia sp. 499 TaxID=1261634 RepID=UPI000952CC68|nr:5'-methylthioadenosine/adenosylhomocysteine nucleosidase [Roseburia sp. 499]WVK68940.1 5'-methylthioadenosine/adenosylhomocysteine nucleosidase [Roseburia sp. 499]
MKRVGIIGAMALEVEELKSKMEITRKEERASMEFLEGMLNGTDVVIVQSGIGKVNAALCTQILCDMFDVTHIINTGVAGSLKNEINIGDIVVSTDALHHDVDVRVFGYPLGEVPQMGCLAFPADEKLNALAVECCKEVNKDISVYSGRIVSGDQFISDKQVKDNIISNFDGFCVEMEGASIAHAAYLNHVPFVIIRAISDKADDSAEMDYPTFEKAAAAHSAALVEHMLPMI